MQALEVSLKLPDYWQQEAIRALQAGADVIVDAPTGAGKTYVFELLVESGLRGQAVYTVPTRALANDKLNEWRQQGWNVGIATGDLAENLDAPVLVATLETQKHKLLRGEGPALLVIDEYQMLGDPSRGLNYELAIATAPPDTQLLLLSGTVGNPADVQAWLQRLGRRVQLIRHEVRPVPLEEVQVEGLPDRLPASVRGFWTRIVGRSLKAGLGPLLAFAPRRRAAEGLASKLAVMLPEDDPLVLTPEQKHIAGDTLARLLRCRIAYHHSGLDYQQRAGLIEPLAKAGQLRVVVATMGLSAGINFSLRSVLVTDREYRAGDDHRLVRPDELQQMFGRAGRRGLDKRGYILVAPGKPRLSEARPIQLKRGREVEWASLLGVMSRAVYEGRDPGAAAQVVASRLFSKERVRLGLAVFAPDGPASDGTEPPPGTAAQVTEILGTRGRWERRRAPARMPLKEVLVYDGGRWRPALQIARVLRQVKVGTLCRLGQGEQFRFGREVPIARLGMSEQEGELVLTRWLLRELRTHFPGHGYRRQGWSLERIERELLPQLPVLTGGGVLDALNESKGMFMARLDFAEAEVLAFRDSTGAGLLNPPERERAVQQPGSFAEMLGTNEGPRGRRGHTVADAWYQLGLIDERARPTRRGTIVSFFNHGEGLAVAAALEDESYPLEELAYDLANLRAGHRFGEHETRSGRLGMACRAAYKNASVPGYLAKGVPLDYGDGAAEILLALMENPSRKAELVGEELGSGDIERARLEWRSLLNHICAAPDLDWDRWLDFKEVAREVLVRVPGILRANEFPELTPDQRRRHKSFLRFD